MSHWLFDMVLYCTYKTHILYSPLSNFHCPSLASAGSNSSKWWKNLAPSRNSTFSTTARAPKPGSPGVMPSSPSVHRPQPGQPWVSWMARWCWAGGWQSNGHTHRMRSDMLLFFTLSLSYGCFIFFINRDVCH